MNPVVNAAREWIGTPYRHQASVRGQGCDCLGLVRGVWRDLYGFEPWKVPAYSADWSEAVGEERLWRALAVYAAEKPKGKAVVGDIVLLRMREGSVAKHLGIQTALGASPMFVHAYSGHGVTEGRLSRGLTRRIVARFEFPSETK